MELPFLKYIFQKKDFILLPLMIGETTFEQNKKLVNYYLIYIKMNKLYLLLFLFLFIGDLDLVILIMVSLLGKYGLKKEIKIYIFTFF